MSKSETNIPEDDTLKTQVASELDQAKNLARSLNFEDVKSGEWFIHLLQKVIQAYDHNARATYFQHKYPGLPPDEIADILTSVTVRYATIAGAIAGAAATANQITALSSAGMSTALFLGSIGAEMLYLAQIQMRLVLDLSVVYDLQLDAEDPEDMLMIFGYALGVTPTEMLGKGLQVAASAATKGAVKKYISKGTLTAIKDFARRLGFKILQRTILKYAVPVASAAVGSSYNYATTQSVGRIAKAHFKNRGKVTDELRVLVSRQNTYDIAFPAAVMYVAQVDGQFSQKEKEFYKAVLSRMSFDEHTQAEFQKLIASEDNILDAMAKIEDVEVRHSLMDTLILMAICDGELAEKERDFLEGVAERLSIALDVADIERRTQDYQIVIQKNLLEKSAGIAGGAAVKAIGVAGQAARSVKGTATGAGETVKGVFGKAFTRKKDDESKPAVSEKSTVICLKCGKEVQSEYQFCPICGQSTATEKSCMSCGKPIPIDFAFCPYCGVTQV
ncbi:MAG: zinc ribbon domain-containing protein [Anaerolineales bacterium]|jgi:tellurite resistance protein/RNA polymerase subunit RPABC4/transcription elongation factor Spt4|nr:zinc ribbon domain-containing protein [Anaerolineales bacterium]